MAAKNRLCRLAILKVVNRRSITAAETFEAAFIEVGHHHRKLMGLDGAHALTDIIGAAPWRSLQYRQRCLSSVTIETHESNPKASYCLCDRSKTLEMESVIR